MALTNETQTTELFNNENIKNNQGGGFRARHVFNDETKNILITVAVLVALSIILGVIYGFIYFFKIKKRRRRKPREVNRIGHRERIAPSAENAWEKTRRVRTHLFFINFSRSKPSTSSSSW